MYTPPIATAKQESSNKSLVVNFLIDEILIELGNESEIRNDSILLFPSINKQDISTMDPNARFKLLSLTSHEKELEQSRGKKCTT